MNLLAYFKYTLRITPVVILLIVTSSCSTGGSLSYEKLVDRDVRLAIQEGWCTEISTSAKVTAIEIRGSQEIGLLTPDPVMMIFYTATYVDNDQELSFEGQASYFIKDEVKKVLGLGSACKVPQLK